MTFFGAIWILLIVYCMCSKIENMIVLTIISSTIQCSNVIVLNGVGIGPQVITSIACIARIWLAWRNLKVTIYLQKLLLFLGTIGIFLCVLLSSIINGVISQNYMRIMQLVIYIFCFLSMFYAGKFLSNDFVYVLIRKLTIALMIIGAIQIGITSGILPRLSIIRELLYNDTTSDVIYYTRDNYHRILSTYMEPSYFAGFAVGSFYYFLFYKEKRSENIVLLGIIMAEILLTFSSSAYGAFAFAGIIFLASSKEKNLKILIIVGATLGFVVMYTFFFDVLDTVIFSKATSGSAVARHYWNLAAIRNFNSSPVWGVGYKMSRASSIIYTILSEIGIIGMIVYIQLNLTILFPILSIRYKKTDNETKGLRLAIISVVLTQLIAVPDLDICTYWMWMNLLALRIAINQQNSKRKVIK